MELLFSLAAFGVINLLAAISPGPDFFVVSKNSIAYSRRIGIFTAVGVGCGIFVHVAYTVIGIGFVISQSILLFSLIKIAGAIYLCYLGIALLRSKSDASLLEVSVKKEISSKTAWAAFGEGFLTNVLNPKAAVFFVSVFSQLVSPALPLALQSLYGLEAAIIVGTWFVILALTLSYSKVKDILNRFQSHILKTMGAVLILLGIKLAFSRQ